VSVDKAGSAELRDIATSLGRAGVQYETLSAPALRSRYPCLSFDDSFGAVFDPTAGILRADKCLAAFQVQYDRSENAYRCLRLVCALRRGLLNEVNARRARLQLGLVTVFERVYHLGL